MVVFRVVLHHPTLVSHLFSICTPYEPPRPLSQYQPTEALVRGPLPQFAYQLNLADPNDVEKAMDASTAALRGFLNGVYGGRKPDGSSVFHATKGIDLKDVEKVSRSPLLSDKVLAPLFETPYS